MKRADALIACRVAGYHDDRRTFTRVYTEHRVTYKAAQAEFDRGVRMRAAGVSCGCPSCRRSVG